MKLPHIKEYSRKGLTSIPYQFVGDSPTIKYYTRWSYFTPYIESLYKNPTISIESPGDSEEWTINVGPKCRGLTRNVSGLSYTSTSNANVGVNVENKVIAAHYVALDKVDVVHITDTLDNTVSVNLCYPRTSSKWISRHLIVVVDPDVSVKLLLRDASRGYVDYAVSTIIEFIIGSRARVELLEVTIPPTKSPSYYLRRMMIGDSARVNVSGISSGGLMHHHRVESVIKKDSVLVEKRLCIGRWSTRSDNIINTVHRGMHSRSSIEAYGVALDSSYVVVRGNVRISEEAKRASTTFKARVLLFGQNSKGYTAPMIEVDTGDILQASHSASQYRLGVNELFYLRSRGLSFEEIEDLVINGLLDKIINGIGVDLSLVKDDLSSINLKLIQQSLEHEV